jgi:hypothetical protein
MLARDVTKFAGVVPTFRMNTVPQTLETFLHSDIEEKWFVRNLEAPQTKLYGIISQKTLILTNPRESWP